MNQKKNDFFQNFFSTLNVYTLNTLEIKNGKDRRGNTAARIQGSLQ